MYKFSDVFEFQKKSKIKAGDGKPEGKYPFYTSSIDLNKYVDDYLFDSESLVFGTGGNASVHFAQNKFAVSTDCLVAQTNTKDVNPKFVYYYLSGNIHILEQGFKGAGLKHISKAYISDITFPAVSRGEQNDIVRIFDIANSLRQKRKEQLTLLDVYLKSVFLEMFGDPVRNEKGWAQLSLGDISADMKYGTNIKCFEHPEMNSIPVLRIPNIYKSDIDLTDLKYGILDKKERNKLLLKKNDLLFVRTNGNPDFIGRCAVFNLKGDYINASYLIRVRLKEKSQIEPSFICYVVSLPSYRSKITKESRTTAGNYNINTQGLKNLKIIQPPLELQNKFADIVDQVEQAKQKMRASLDKMDNHFNALMQRYFG